MLCAWVHRPGSGGLNERQQEWSFDARARPAGAASRCGEILLRRACGSGFGQGRRCRRCGAEGPGVRHDGDARVQARACARRPAGVLLQRGLQGQVCGRPGQVPGKAAGAAMRRCRSREPEPVVEGATYTCPMHPEIRQDHPGACPKCGMALEPEMPSVDEGESPELIDFRRRFWWTLPLTLVVAFLAMFGHRLQWFEMATQSWIELLLTLPVVLWAGRPFFERGVQSLINRSPNMWTLDRPGHRRGLRLQRRGHRRAAAVSGVVRVDGPRGGVLRGGGGDHLADACSASCSS